MTTTTNTTTDKAQLEKYGRELRYVSRLPPPEPQHQPETPYKKGSRKLLAFMVCLLALTGGAVTITNSGSYTILAGAIISLFTAYAAGNVIAKKFTGEKKC